MRISTDIKQHKVLVFDIENRPLSYWVPDRPTAEVTAIACKWLGEHETFCFLQESEFWNGVPQTLERFRKFYDQADVVLGHYIRRHDLPILHGAYLENGLPGLTPKMTIDTKLDLTKYKDIPASLEYLADLLGCPIEKFQMSQHKWRAANRFEMDGLALTKKRVESDILINEWVYNELIRRRWLTKGMKEWKP